MINRRKLVCELEYIIGNRCYNPNSYDGWNHYYGRSYRYPICYMNKEGEEVKTSYKIRDSEMNNKNISSIIYKFGSNYLYIGEGLTEVLEFLEKRYNIDFYDLEKKYKEKERRTKEKREREERKRLESNAARVSNCDIVFDDSDLPF